MEILFCGQVNDSRIKVTVNWKSEVVHFAQISWNWDLHAHTKANKILIYGGSAVVTEQMKPKSLITMILFISCANGGSKQHLFSLCQLNSS